MRVHPRHFSRRAKKELPLAMMLLLATVFAFGFDDSKQNKAAAMQSSRMSQAKILVALRDINPNTEISLEDIGLELRPLESIPLGMTTDSSLLVGRTTKAAIPKGKPVLLHELAPVEVRANSIDKEKKLEVTEPAPRAEIAEQQPSPTKTSRVQSPRQEKQTISRVKRPELSKSPAPAKNATIERSPSQKASSAPRPKKRGYVWVPGSEYKYEVVEEGVRVVPPHGSSRPLHQKGN